MKKSFLALLNILPFFSMKLVDRMRRLTLRIKAPLIKIWLLLKMKMTLEN